jgi:uncharacterized protein YbbC (DUF1343 family)
VKTTTQLIFIIISVIIFSCKTNNNLPASNSGVYTDTVTQKKMTVKTGIDVLQKSNFAILKGKRVGLVTNPTGVNCNLKSTIDILFESQNVNLVALFAPEHGVRGNLPAGKQFNTIIDKKTGLPVFSLYGRNKIPSAKAMTMIDVIVYDIQDIGVRSYTFISTMGIIMETAANYDKEVLILDRPNPLGGNRVEGSFVDSGFYSFVSRYNIPYIYGLTCGELALLMNNENLLRNGKQCNLQVVRMQNWTRDMTFGETGLQWVPTSPHIPCWQTAYYYAATGIIGELNSSMIGIGYTLPFQVLALKNTDADKLTFSMNSLNLQGVTFRPVYFKPFYGTNKGIQLKGVQIHISDFKNVNLTQIQFLFLQEAHKIDLKFNIFNNSKNNKSFDLACGSDKYRILLMKYYTYDSIKNLWNKNSAEFKKTSNKYYLYN